MNIFFHRYANYMNYSRVSFCYDETTKYAYTDFFQIFSKATNCFFPERKNSQPPDLAKAFLTGFRDLFISQLSWGNTIFACSFHFLEKFRCAQEFLPLDLLKFKRFRLIYFLWGTFGKNWFKIQNVSEEKLLPRVRNSQKYRGKNKFHV